jgi:hypothetical protein
LSAWARRYLKAQGAVLTLVALALLIAPTAMIGAWPWKATPLLLQIYSSPFLSYGLGSFLLARQAVWLEVRLGGTRGRLAFVAAMLLAVAVNAGVIAGDVREQHQKPFLLYHEHGKYEPLIRLARDAGSVVGERDVVIAQEDRVVSYYSRRKTLPPITARRWAPRPEEVAAFRGELAAAEHVFVLLPGEKVEQLVNEWKIGVDPVPVLTASGPLTKGNRKEVSYALYRASLPPAPPSATTSTHAPPRP